MKPFVSRFEAGDLVLVKGFVFFAVFEPHDHVPPVDPLPQYPHSHKPWLVKDNRVDGPRYGVERDNHVSVPAFVANGVATVYADYLHCKEHPGPVCFCHLNLSTF